MRVYPKQARYFLLDIVQYRQTAELAGITDKMKIPVHSPAKGYIIRMASACEYRD
jgi:hypothetical protein